MTSLDKFHQVMSLVVTVCGHHDGGYHGHGLWPSLLNRLHTGIISGTKASTKYCSATFTFTYTCTDTITVPLLLHVCYIYMNLYTICIVHLYL